MPPPPTSVAAVVSSTAWLCAPPTNSLLLLSPILLLLLPPLLLLLPDTTNVLWPEFTPLLLVIALIASAGERNVPAAKAPEPRLPADEVVGAKLGHFTSSQLFLINNNAPLIAEEYGSHSVFLLIELILHRR